MRLGKNHNIGAKRARQARDALGLSPVDPLPCLLTAVEDAGADVVVGGLRDDVEGACLPGGLMFLGTDMALTRRRFTLAHELGHFRIGHDGGAKLDTWETLSGAATNDHEVQANAFAAEFLMPREGIRELLAGVDPTLEHLTRFADLYGTSAHAMLIRFRTCEVSEATRERLKAEVAANEHLTLAHDLGLPGVSDRLSQLDELPYVSPGLRETALGYAIRGERTVAEAAWAAGVPAAQLQAALDPLAVELGVRPA